jgi:hypothetical protein
MGSMASVAKVVVIPRNGYANRLQAWASAAIVARHWGAPLAVCWETEAVAPADAHALFRGAGEGAAFISSKELERLLGGSHEQLPRYLTHVPEDGIVTLAGHDRGEQPFMADLDLLAKKTTQPLTVVLIAGGRFHVPGETDFETQRRDFYRSLEWSNAIRERVDDVHSTVGPYIGMHVRGTDKAITVPTQRSLQQSILAVADRTGIESVFVAADTAGTRRLWLDRLKSHGKAPWFVDSTTHDRGSSRAGIDALVEWNLLARSTAMVFAEDSSFGHEAAISTLRPEMNMGLTAPAWRQTARKASNVIRAGLTYPARHGWLGRQ